MTCVDSLNGCNLNRYSSTITRCLNHKDTNKIGTNTHSRPIPFEFFIVKFVKAKQHALKQSPYIASHVGTEKERKKERNHRQVKKKQENSQMMSIQTVFLLCKRREREKTKEINFSLSK